MSVSGIGRLDCEIASEFCTGPSQDFSVRKHLAAVAQEARASFGMCDRSGDFDSQTINIGCICLQNLMPAARRSGEPRAAHRNQPTSRTVPESNRVP